VTIYFANLLFEMGLEECILYAAYAAKKTRATILFAVNLAAFQRMTYSTLF